MSPSILVVLESKGVCDMSYWRAGELLTPTGEIPEEFKKYFPALETGELLTLPIP